MERKNRKGRCSVYDQRWDGGDWIRSYLKFTHIGLSLAGKYIDNSYLYVNESANSEKGVIADFNRITFRMNAGNLVSD